MSLLRRIDKRPEAVKNQNPAPAQPATAPSSVQRRPVPRARDAYMDLKNRVQNRLISELDPAMDVSRTDEVRVTIKEMYEDILQEEVFEDNENTEVLF